MGAIEHLPGCNLQHLPRQRCSSWQAPAPQEPPPIDPRPTERASPGTAARFGCLLLAAILGFPIAVIVSIVAAVTLVLTGIFAADRAGLVDLDYWGYPDYVVDSTPDGAVLVERMHCCGGSGDGSGETQFFYANDLPYEEVVAHYRSEMSARGYGSGSRFDEYLSGATETWFDVPDERYERAFKICFSIAPFTDNYRLDRSGWNDDSADRVRQKLSESLHPYVAFYASEDWCGG